MDFEELLPSMPGVVAVGGMPAGVVIIEDQVMINVGDRSPDWVNELAATPAGQQLLCRILTGIIKRSKVDGTYQDYSEGSGDGEA